MPASVYLSAYAGCYNLLDLIGGCSYMKRLLLDRAFGAYIGAYQLIASSLGESLLRFLAVFLIAGELGLEDFGDFSVVIAASAISAAICNFGAYNLVMAADEDIGAIYGKEFLFLSINLALLGSLVLPLMIFGAGYTIDVIAVFFAETLLLATQSITYAGLLSQGESKVLSSVRLKLSLLFLSVSVIWAKFFGGQNFYIYYISYSLLGFFLYVYISHRYLKACFVCCIDDAWYLQRVRDGQWFLLSGLSRTIFFNADKILISFLYSSSTVAIYSIAMRMFNTIFNVVNAGLSSTEALYYKLEAIELKEHYIKAVKLCLILSLALWAVIVASGKFVEIILPEGFEDSLNSFFILSSALFFQVLLWNNLNLLNGLRLEFWRFACMVFGCISLIAINFVFSMLMPENPHSPSFSYVTVIVLMMIFSFCKVRKH
ncbi:oligosaccharide flippase family protein [Gallaecimonas sp. GXIMD4217]|uniref:oligosaccharide flippase family protein n=1 Tax=Gallaecimonas sp. GXIMD4217 TaxID=3131927 RepID=UPI00311AE7BA